MPTRVPQDIDLEDRLVFNLTPLQFGYLVIGALAGGILWKLPWAPSALRLAVALPLVGASAVFAWGRWRGRSLDAWVADVAIFCRANGRVRWVPSATRGLVVRRAFRRSATTPRSWRRRRGTGHPRPPALPPHDR